MRRANVARDVAATVTNVMYTPDPTTTRSCTRRDVFEHVLRSTADDLLVFEFLDSEPGSQQFLAALGRLLSHGRPLLPPGSPLRIWAQTPPGHMPAPAQDDWRERCPPTANSLWGELQLLLSLCGADDHAADDPLQLLLTLRSKVHDTW